MRQTITAMSAMLLLLAMPLSHADEKSGDKAVDEVTVYAKMSMSKLRKEVHRSAEDFYDLFNQLNDDDMFDVRCTYVRPTGSRIRNHVCKARYIDKAETEHALRNWDNRLSVAQQDVGTEMAELNARFEEKLATTVASSPELATRLNRYNTARSIYLERQQQRASR